MSTFSSIVGLAFALGGFEAEGWLRNALSLPDEGLWPHVWKWVPALSLLGFVRYVEDESLSSVGWRSLSARRFAAETAAGLVVMLGANVVMGPVFERIESAETEEGTDEGSGGVEAGIGSFAVFSVPERLFIAFTAGATEELLFRGYATERLLSLTGSRFLAGIVPTVVHTWGHLGGTWDRSAVLRIAQPGLLTGALYLRVRNLPVLVAVHALNDTIGLLLADRYTDDGE